jgi:hypothetical protein
MALLLSADYQQSTLLCNPFVHAAFLTKTGAELPEDDAGLDA